MTQITPVDAGPILQTSIDNGTTTQASASSEPAVRGTEQPAVIISLGGTASAGQQQLPEANPDAVSKTLASLGAVNGFSWVYEHINWDELEQKRGIEWVNEQKAISLRALGVFALNAAINLASSSAIPVHRVANSDATVDKPLKTTYTASNFSFLYNADLSIPPLTQRTDS